ncbi:MAG: SPOR domain-containing protein [Arsenophonus sp.]|nr:MAG: SPOR domain-containing protein [Arsenophonus sp.]
MKNKFKNRLIGLIFVVIISIMISPILLNRDKYNKTEFAVIPVIPQLQKINNMESITEIKSALKKTSENFSSEIISKETSATKLNKHFDFYQTQKNKQNSKIKQDILATKDNTKPHAILYQKPQGKAYIIQLGVLKNTEKAKEILTKLRIYGYQVYTKSSFKNNNQLTHIFIGPNLSKQKLQMHLSKLKDLTGLEGQIHIFKP